MKNISLFLSVLFLLSITFTFQNALAAKKVAKAIIIRGNVHAITPDNKRIKLKKNDWLVEGTIVETSKKSFIKLLLVDKSGMNVGPSSKMKIEQFPAGKPGMISLLKGQVRTKVQKDHLASKDSKDAKSKFYLKTRTAAMGVRGTDFLTTYNEANQATNTITFEGEVQMVQVSGDAEIGGDGDKIENLINTPAAATVVAGTFSSANPTMNNTTSIATKLSPPQFNALKGNVEQKSTSSVKQDHTKGTDYRSIIPPGTNAKSFMASNSSAIGSAIGTNIANAVQTEIKQSETTSTPPEGMVNEDTKAVAPPAGGFLDLKSGIYVAPPPGSTYDNNTKVYELPANFGKINKTGDYVPPTGMKIDPIKAEFIVTATEEPEKVIEPTKEKTATDVSKDKSKDKKKKDKKKNKGKQKVKKGVPKIIKLTSKEISEVSKTFSNDDTLTIDIVNQLDEMFTDDIIAELLDYEIIENTSGFSNVSINIIVE